MAKTTVKIKIRAFPYYVDAVDPITEKKIKREVVATRGDVVELNDGDLERAVRLGAVADPEETAAQEEATGGDFEPELASVEELSEWIETAKPNIDKTVAASGGDKEVANRLLEAENLATGNDPRAGVVAGLTAIISRTEG